MHSRNINIVDAKPGMELAEAVYIITGTGTNMLAARKGAELDSGLITMLTRRNVKTVEIVSDEPDEPREHAI